MGRIILYIGIGLIVVVVIAWLISLIFNDWIITAVIMFGGMAIAGPFLLIGLYLMTAFNNSHMNKQV